MLKAAAVRVELYLESPFPNLESSTKMHVLAPKFYVGWGFLFRIYDLKVFQDLTDVTLAIMNDSLQTELVGFFVLR